MITEEFFLQSEQYLKGKLSDNERNAFIESLKSDPEKEQSVALQKKLIHSVKLMERAEFKKQLLQADNQNHRSNKLFFNGIKSWMAIAAGILLLTGLFFLFREQFSNNQHQIADATLNRGLTSEFFTPPDNIYIPVTRGTDIQEQESASAKAMILYENAKYSECYLILDEKIKNGSGTEDDSFYAAMCLTSLDSLSQALLILEAIEKNPSSMYFQYSEWFAALIRYDLGQKDQAIEGFKRIALSKSEYAAKASHILDSL